VGRRKRRREAEVVDTAADRQKRSRNVAEALEEAVTLRVGKNGLSDGFVAEVRSHIESDRVVRVRLPKGLEREERVAMAETLASSVGATIVDLRGNTLLLEKNRGKKGSRGSG